MLLDDERVKEVSDDPELLVHAAKKGSAGIVKHLLSNSLLYPAYDNDMALRVAIYGGHVSTVQLLLKDPRVNAKNITEYDWSELMCNALYTERKAKRKQFETIIQSLASDKRLWIPVHIQNMFPDHMQQLLLSRKRMRMLRGIIRFICITKRALHTSTVDGKRKRIKRY